MESVGVTVWAGTAGPDGFESPLDDGVERLWPKLYYSEINELLKHSAESSAFVGHKRLLSAECPNFDGLVPLRYTRAEDFDPGEKEDVPFASAVIKNAVGRFLIRARLTGSVETVPVDALAYLGGIPYQTEGDVAREESFSYGWGIGHPEHAVLAHVSGAIHNHMFWVKAVLEHSFYADQHAALDLLTELIHDDSIEFSVSHPSGEIEKLRFLLSSISGLATNYWPQIPRYWDWRRGLDYTFEWEPEVDQQLRDLITETSVGDDLIDDWTFQDLTL